MMRFGSLRRIGAVFVLLVVLSLAIAASASAARYFLGTPHADSLMAPALTRKPGRYFAKALGPRIRCNQRLASDRLKCDMGWALGDWIFYGSGSIWITYEEGQPHWNFSYRVVRKNEYCASVAHGSHCPKTFIVR